MRLSSRPQLTALVAVVVTLAASPAFAQSDPQLTGTWSTKSNKVFTGPGFYDPVQEQMIEPENTGISYSFTDDGFYESAHYRAISNPTRPQCPKGIMQFQHGTFTKHDNGSLVLTPFAVDGRQLLSDPCRYKNSVYTRYSQVETFKRYEVLTDKYHNVLRLNLYRFDGAPMNPMYLAYKPPQMLPTKTMNPTTSAATATAAATATGTAGGSSSSSSSSKRKRSLEDMPVPLNRNVIKRRAVPADMEVWWWFSLGLTLLGGVAYIFF